ncbi:hypothetical protein LAZ67_7002496 [Cordylochernes scorpioides]|uniref:Agrin n=1 Tax=Cordylochernes scorpioides TaxID=51811 RepID=A0ABY6KN97_9ARAC|nr:hypothetical protein LAZ67_7002496 [Cordylochernes scorpioides]
MLPDAKKCDKLCLYGGVCQYNNEGYPQCFCHFHCQPPSAHETICTSEGKQYPSRCFLKKEACRRQKPVKVVPCPAQCATLSPGSVRVNPGWGDSAVTPVSLGTGDYEPKDVYRSVRTECGCSEAGSVREDCDQSTGRCVCRAGVQGRRCNLCPPGSVLLDKWGCKRVVAARNCSELHCGFGARCREKRRRAHCVCDLHCSAEDTRVPVCGADGTTYSSECELRLYRCRHQRAVALLYRGPCTSPDGIPQFSGQSYLQLEKLQAYTRLAIELEFQTFSDFGLLLYNGGAEGGSGDFVSLSVRDGHLEYRYNVGSGLVMLRSPARLQPGRFHTASIRRFLGDGLLSLDRGEEVTGRSLGPHTSLDLSGPLYLGSLPHSASRRCRMWTNAGVKQGLLGCIRRLKIGRREVNLQVNTSRDILHVHKIADPQCVPRLHANCTCGCSTCNHLSSMAPDLGVSDPGELRSVAQLSGQGHLQLSPLTNVGQAFTLELWLLASRPDGLVLYSGSSGDFLALYLVDSRLGFVLDQGSGPASLSSHDPVTLGKWHHVRLTKLHRKVSLQVDNGPVVAGETKGHLAEMNLAPPLYVGGHPNSQLGLSGSVRGLRLNGEQWDHRVVSATAMVELPALKVTKKVKSMQMFRKPISQAVQGDRVGICVTQFDPAQLERGLICSPGHLTYATHAIVAVHRIPYFRAEILTKAKFHITALHDTRMAKLTFFSPVPGSGETFDLSQEYSYQSELTATAEGEAWYDARSSRQYVLLEFVKPTILCPGSLIIGSHLDYDIHSKSCRLAFHGQVLQLGGPELLPALRVFKVKSKEGMVDRMSSPHDIIVRNLFKKETNLKLFQSLPVVLSTGEQGAVEGWFGQSGKVKVHIPGGLQPSTQELLAKKKGKEQPPTESVNVSIHFKRFIFDPNKTIVKM